jgi:hypothetical protein
MMWDVGGKIAIGAFALIAATGFASGANAQSSPVDVQQIVPSDTLPAGNSASVSITGSNNAAILSQTYTGLTPTPGNSAAVTQNGNDNWASVEQFGQKNQAAVGEYGTGLKAEIVQNGANLGITVNQYGQGTGSTVSISQFGMGVAPVVTTKP